MINIIVVWYFSVLLSPQRSCQAGNLIGILEPRAAVRSRILGTIVVQTDTPVATISAAPLRCSVAVR